ncbi:TetR/AcrR family transcriptional regulator [Leekyejoonella antrihumi]|uniref:TetR/AcrR family transcriptional regulator n=2 Tax=Leekyejoonella antrihumi TaxID=1660198 RepID=A0A563E6S5_9MICO|nr:TetR/AcrR family transcriptional regulator [Leekyejoonella antrihumi]
MFNLHFGAIEGKTDLMTEIPTLTLASVDSFESALTVLVAPPEDARTIKRRQAARRVTYCAQRLAVERGYEEFTLDDLAQEAGVSRRTLFNYFPGKLEAVLGNPPRLALADVEAFLEGRPTGNLMHDLSVLVLALLQDEDLAKDEWVTTRRCFERNPKLLVAAMGKFHKIAAAAQQLIAKREGVPADSARARICVGLLAGLFDVSINEFVESEDRRTVADTYMDNLKLASRLLRDTAD